MSHAWRRETAYRWLVEEFVCRDLSAPEFLSRFTTLWNHDQLRVDGVEAVPWPRVKGQSLSALRALHGLCATYSRNLPDGAGYRVSEEQFRREVHCLVDGVGARCA